MTPETIKLRARFQREGIDQAAITHDPMMVFRDWRDAGMAVAGPGQSPFALSTVDASGRPSIRMMDVVEIDHGFVFVTHQGSRKGRDLAGNAHVALCFAWGALGRQVSILGLCEQLDTPASEHHFAAMPPGIQLVAATTRQSALLPTRSAMESAFEGSKAKANGHAVARPADWFAYRVLPTEIEFWQRRPNELQDRIRYRRATVDAAWVTERVSP